MMQDPVRAIQLIQPIETGPVPARHLVSFCNQRDEVGWLDCKDGQLTFGGNMAESARIFFEAVLKPLVEACFETEGERKKERSEHVERIVGVCRDPIQHFALMLQVQSEDKTVSVVCDTLESPWKPYPTHGDHFSFGVAYIFPEEDAEKLREGLEFALPLCRARDEADGRDQDGS